MHPHSRMNGVSTPGRFSPPTLPKPSPACTSRSNPQVDAFISMVNEQEREARRLRESGEIGEAMASYRAVIRLCGDVSRRLGRGGFAAAFEDKKLQMQKELEAMAITGGYQPNPALPLPSANGLPRPSAKPATVFVPKPTPVFAPKAAPVETPELPEISGGLGLGVVPQGRVGGFRNPVTELKLDEATWKEYVTFSRKLQKEADELKEKGDVAGAVAKLREAADIWNYAASCPRFQFFDTLRSTARGIADTYMINANALQNPNGQGAAAALNGPASSQVEEAEIDRKVRACIVEDTPENKVAWQDIIGVKEAKNALLSSLLDRYIYKGPAQNETRGVLLYGPAGTGKTMLVRGVVNLVTEKLKLKAQKQAEKKAQQEVPEPTSPLLEKSSDDSNNAPSVSDNETQSDVPPKITLFKITPADVDSKWVGEGSKFVQKLFQLARDNQPAVMFLDEADSLFSKRGEGQNEATGKIMTQFMQELDGLTSKGNITMIAASNVPHRLDNAVLRRLQRSVYVPVPEPEDRVKLLKWHVKHAEVPVNLPEEKCRELALSKVMDNFTGDDIKRVFEAACARAEADLHEAEAFREIDGEFEPCDPHDEGAVVGQYYDLFVDGDFKHLPTTFAHLHTAALNHYPTASDQIADLEKWRAQQKARKS